MFGKIGLAAILSASLITESCAQKKYSNETQVLDFIHANRLINQYVSDKYPVLVQELKDKHYKYVFLKETPLPEIDYFLFGGSGIEGASGMYNPDESRILISLINNTYLSNGRMKIGNKTGIVQFDEMLKHEFIHYYTHMLSENIGCGRFPAEREIGLPGREALKYLDILKSEGISETLVPARKRRHDFSDADWVKINKNLLDPQFDISAIYTPARHFVKPIIDEYGEAGIIAIIREKTMPDDINDIPGLRNRILEKLKK